MYRVKVDDGVFLELSSTPKGCTLPDNYVNKVITFFDEATGATPQLSFIVNEKLYNYLDRIGYMKKFLHKYNPHQILYNVNFPVDPDDKLPFLVIIIQISLH